MCAAKKTVVTLKILLCMIISKLCHKCRQLFVTGVHSRENCRYSYFGIESFTFYLDNSVIVMYSICAVKVAVVTFALLS